MLTGRVVEHQYSGWLMILNNITIYILIGSMGNHRSVQTIPDSLTFIILFNSEFVLILIFKVVKYTKGP